MKRAHGREKKTQAIKRLTPIESWNNGELNRELEDTKEATFLLANNLGEALEAGNVKEAKACLAGLLGWEVKPLLLEDKRQKKARAEIASSSHKPIKTPTKSQLETLAAACHSISASVSQLHLQRLSSDLEARESDSVMCLSGVDLVRGVCINVLSYLNGGDKSIMAQVSNSWSKLNRNPAVWSPHVSIKCRLSSEVTKIVNDPRFVMVRSVKIACPGANPLFKKLFKALPHLSRINLKNMSAFKSIHLSQLAQSMPSPKLLQQLVLPMMIDSLPPSILHAFENLQVLDFLLLPRLANHDQHRAFYRAIGGLKRLAYLKCGASIGDESSLYWGRLTDEVFEPVIDGCTSLTHLSVSGDLTEVSWSRFAAIVSSPSRPGLHHLCVSTPTHFVTKPWLSAVSSIISLVSLRVIFPRSNHCQSAVGFDEEFFSQSPSGRTRKLCIPVPEQSDLFRANGEATGPGNQWATWAAMGFTQRSAAIEACGDFPFSSGGFVTSLPF